MANRGLTHIDHEGRPRMVDVGEKSPTDRRATAEAVVRVSDELARAIKDRTIAKGNLLEIARIAGIQAAKRTDELIPLCHPLPLDHIAVDAELECNAVKITATARTHARTGVEMEALTAASVAALTVVDMGKSVDRAMVIECVRILSKSGGASGEYSVPSS